jgi:hypothetical protein
MLHQEHAKTEPRRGTSRGANQLWIKFLDDRTEAQYTLWCFAADARAAANLRSRPAVIGVGLLHDSVTELDERAYRLRLKDTGFRWHKHIDGAEGFRLIVEVPDFTSTSPEDIARAVVGKLLHGLQRARFLP